ncbi:MAG: LpxI family protein, partial [Candidatus Binataceae bacterium]
SVANVNKLGLIAGNGVFPIEVAAAARRLGMRVVAIAHQNESLPELEQHCDSLTWIKVGELERMIAILKDAGVKRAAMAGGISRERLKDSFFPDQRTMKMLARVGRLSDDSVLRGIAEEIESEGIEVIDPVPMLDGVLARDGLEAGPAPTSAQLKDLDLAFSVARLVGSYDIGQTVAVRDGVVAAVEGVEGTDAAVRRAAALCGRGLVIAKASKPAQDLRFDRPAIGPRTIELLAEIGAAVIGVESHKTLLLERARTLEIAGARGVSVYGHG